MGTSGPAPVKPTRPLRPAKGSPATVGMLKVVNCAMAGVGSVYLTTHSALVTLIAAVCAVILGGFTLLMR
jgi:hypothetical protein